MGKRYISVRIEIETQADDTAEAREIGDRLAQVARRAVENHPGVRRVTFASHVLRKD